MGSLWHIVLLLWLCGATSQTTPPGGWVRVESTNFVVFGELGEKQTREYAEEFERFREALARR